MTNGGGPSLKGKACLVTGGTSGIGGATAAGLAALGGSGHRRGPRPGERPRLRRGPDGADRERGRRLRAGGHARARREAADTGVYLASAPEIAEVTGRNFIKRWPASSQPQTHDPLLARRLWESCEMLVAGAAA
jgi:hypothetical protein